MTLMIRPFTLAIAFRFARSGHQDRFVSFLNIASLIGIALGVAVLMTVMAVMNGFSKEIKAQWLSHTPHLLLQPNSTQTTHALPTQEKRAQQLKQVSKEIDYVAPWIQSEALLTYNKQVLPSLLLGVQPDQLPARFYHYFASIDALNHLRPGHFDVLVSPYLAMQWGIRLGDRITLVVPQAEHSILGVTPRFRQVRVVGFMSDADYSYRQAVVMHADDAAVLLRLTTPAYRLWLTHPDQVNKVADQINAQLGSTYHMASWIQHNQMFFKALTLEKNMMTLVLSLIVVIALFYLITSLVMMVRDKRNDIAVFLTMGLTRRRLVLVFLLQGMIISLSALLIGLLLGYCLIEHINEVVSGIEWLFAVHLFDPAVYGINYLPVDIQSQDLWTITIVLSIFSFISSCYPAYRAGCVEPAEVLRYAG
jgi:lipoprotein-releasing system permease protein